MPSEVPVTELVTSDEATIGALCPIEPLCAVSVTVGALRLPTVKLPLVWVIAAEALPPRAMVPAVWLKLLLTLRLPLPARAPPLCA